MFKRLIFSSLSVTVSNVIVRFSVLILSIVAAHTLDVGGLAQFTNLMILYQIVSGLSLAGLSGVLVKTIAETDTVSERIEYAKASLFIITCLSFLFSIVYLVIVAVIYDTLTFDAVIFSISIIFGALYFGLVSTAQGFLDFKSHLFSSIIYTISCLFCVSMFYFLGFDRISLVVLLANIFSFYYLIKTNKKNGPVLLESNLSLIF
ncbi:hypothetical protein NOK75_23405 [Vibrio parahaemolyticus]|uniref:hypothetical protein n=1 Tax=Vibrio parahaemolyticus TaxID=670 RepID=UPI00226B6FC1|nr:hypothetical protein [Vibrio parahaemolyticus]MCX8844828.1 hypothetical protein [Vibrio parahaemolyticus]